MANSYDLNLTDGTLDFTINEKEVIVDHGLTFTGRGVEDYGEHRNTNILHLAEHFASDAFPVNPLTGQIWFDTIGGTVNVFDGATFGPIGSDDFIISGTYETGTSAGLSPPAGPTANAAYLLKNPLGDDDPIDVVITDIAEWSDFNAHLIDAVDAHDAVDIIFAPSGNIIATDLQAAIVELQDEELEDHLNEPTGAHTATAISSSPTGTISSTEVQAAISELENQNDVTQVLNNVVQSDVNNHIADVVDAHDATAISYDNSGSGLAATDVQAAIDEIALSGISGSGSGYVDCVRVTINGNQLIDAGVGGGANGIEEILEFDTIVDGDALGNFDTSPANWKYVADRPMQVRVRAYVRYQGLGRNQYGKAIIRRNGALVRQGIQIKLASDDVNIAAQTVEVSWIDDITTNDEITVHAQIQSFASTVDSNVQSGRVNTGFEVEVLTDLTP